MRFKILSVLIAVVLIVAFNSLYEIHKWKDQLKATYGLTFNSLYEIPKILPAEHVKAVSISFNSLYEIPGARISELLTLTKSFNSLYEIPYLAWYQTSRSKLYFQFSL